jgi:hypothetical protein
MPALSDDRAWFVAERFEQLRDLLFESGYALDPGPRDPNEWHELHYEEPPTGVIRLKGVRLRDLEDDDSDFDPEITFSIEELWSADYVDGAQSERGYDLVEHSYHAHYHGIDQRWDFDPARHPEAPYHRHPPGRGSERRALDGPISPADALQEFANWIEEHDQASREPDRDS